MRPAPERLDPKSLRGMRRAGRATAATLHAACAQIRPGMRLDAIDAFVARDVAARGARSSVLGYEVAGAPPFPGHCCTSRNEVVCHGIPDATELQEGDIVNVDITTELGGWHGDTSRTVHVGTPSPEAAHLVQTTERALAAGIAAVRPGAPLGAIGAAIEAVVRPLGCTLVREFGGHGIGRAMHQPPHVHHVRVPGPSPTLWPGMCFTIEPMVCLGRPEIRMLDDGWTVVTADGRWSAQAEHTVCVTDDGVEILTHRP
ncbi:MAG: type I methionyl aminopeptidase [Myxococcales bacterium]|nr:type I methionyl aminopeptidase [Myxococcales bacterium]